MDSTTMGIVDQLYQDRLGTILSVQDLVEEVISALTVGLLSVCKVCTGQPMSCMSCQPMSCTSCQSMSCTLCQPISCTSCQPMSCTL